MKLLTIIVAMLVAAATVGGCGSCASPLVTPTPPAVDGGIDASLIVGDANYDASPVVILDAGPVIMLDAGPVPALDPTGCYAACVNLAVLGCSEGLTPTCATTCVAAQGITNLKTACLAAAKSASAARACGSVRCVVKP